MRAILLGALILGFLATPLHAAAPEPAPTTPELVQAATKERTISWYTAVDLAVAEKVARAFEAKYPGLSVQVQRSRCRWAAAVRAAARVKQSTSRTAAASRHTATMRTQFMRRASVAAADRAASLFQ